MKLIAEAGTDGATLVLYDPKALPADFDARYKEDPPAVAEAMQTEGRLIWLSPDGDGTYQAHVYIDEPLPSTLAPHVRETVELPRLALPSGALYFMGGEYAFQSDDSFYRQYPDMGQRLEVTPGTYRARVHALEYGSAFVAVELRKGTTAPGRLLLKLAGLFAVLTGFSIFASFGAMFAMSFTLWCKIVLPVPFVGVLLTWGMMRLPAYRAARARQTEVEREMPAYAVELQRLEEGSR